MTSLFSWQNSISLLPASFCTPRPNLLVTPGISWLPPFAFQSPIMKRASFEGVSSRRSYRSSQNHSTSDSSALVVRAQTWITVIVNGLPWKWTEIICSFQGKSNSDQEYKGISLWRNHTHQERNSRSKRNCHWKPAEKRQQTVSWKKKRWQRNMMTWSSKTETSKNN